MPTASRAEFVSFLGDLVLLFEALVLYTFWRCIFAVPCFDHGYNPGFWAGNTAFLFFQPSQFGIVCYANSQAALSWALKFGKMDISLGELSARPNWNQGLMAELQLDLLCAGALLSPFFGWEGSPKIDCGKKSVHLF